MECWRDRLWRFTIVLLEWRRAAWLCVVSWRFRHSLCVRSSTLASGPRVRCAWIGGVAAGRLNSLCRVRRPYLLLQTSNILNSHRRWPLCLLSLPAPPHESMWKGNCTIHGPEEGGASECRIHDRLPTCF
eukprot:scaffold260689_cov40-Tisochrysis_lutea.AAC.1